MALEAADPDSRSLEIKKDFYPPPVLPVDSSHDPDESVQFPVGSVGAVKTHNIHPGVHHPRKGIFCAARRSQCAYDFCFRHYKNTPDKYIKAQKTQNSQKTCKASVIWERYVT